ncbi:hypothetical protein ABZ208_38995 [Streptomyces sp. NPDC006208]|uniref:hypothetical protein n=1 Tax=Streptomyces sp. NPDC006208 TaxID=3156734 RepID=UPI0033A6A08C
MRAHEFDTPAVHELRKKDPELDHALSTLVTGVIAHRLMTTRTRSLNLYATHSAGQVP